MSRRSSAPFPSKCFCPTTSSSVSGRISSAKGLFSLISVVPAAFFRVDGQHDHQRAQCVLRVVNVDHIGIRPVEQLLADGGHLAGAVLNGVVPLHKTAVHGPAAEVQGKRRPEKSKLLADLSYTAVADVQLKLGQERQHPLLHRSDVIAHGVQNVQTMSPRKLALDRKDGVADSNSFSSLLFQFQTQYALRHIMFYLPNGYYVLFPYNYNVLSLFIACFLLIEFYF